MTRIVSHSAGNIQSVRKIFAVRHTESWSDFFITYEVLYNNNSEFTFVLQKIKNFLRHLKAIINGPLTVELFKLIYFMTDVCKNNEKPLAKRTLRSVKRIFFDSKTFCNFIMSINFSQPKYKKKSILKPHWKKRLWCPFWVEVTSLKSIFEYFFFELFLINRINRFSSGWPPLAYV